MPPLLDMLAPLFGTITIGLAAGHFRLFDLADARRFARLVFLVAMPLAVFSFTSTSPPPNPAYFGLVGSYLTALAVTSVAAFFAARRWAGASVQETGAAVFATTCGNAVFLGLPIALSVPGWGPPFLLLMLFEGLLVFAIGTALMTWPRRPVSAGGGRKPDRIAKAVVDALKRAATNPIAMATLAGFSVAITGLPLPRWLSLPTSYAGGIAAPLGLFVLGLYLSILPREAPVVPRRLLAALLPLKLAVFPAITGGLAWMITQDVRLTAVGVFFTAMPPAVSSVVLASAYRTFEPQVTALVAAGTLIGVVLTTALLAGFAALGL